MKAWLWVALASIAAVGGCGNDAATTGGTAPAGGPNAEPVGTVGTEDEPKCAGPEERACPSGKYCATAKLNRCPTDELAGVCREIPQACTHIYQPMCGCDGQTYANECEAAATKAAIAYEGTCAPFCGGFAGIPCPGSGTCVDNATDGCDPLGGDADCASLCRCQVIELCDEGAHWDSSPEVCACVWE